MDMLKETPDGSTSEMRVTDFLLKIVAAVSMLAGVVKYLLTGADIPTGIVQLIVGIVGLSTAGKAVQKFAEKG